MASKTLNALEDPEGTNRVIQKALAEANPMPEADPPSPTLVSLPGGLLAKDGEIISTAEVRELTGEDEEDLARAAQAKPGNIFHYMNTLLECGVKRFGTEDTRRTKNLLKNTLVGDRDALIMGIRRATYGEDVDIEQWTCPSCGQKSDLTIPLEDVPVKEITREQLAPFTVDLRNGRSAEVRLATGADQLSIFEDRRLTAAERDSALLARCLVALVEKDGTRQATAGLASSYARKLGLADRHAILSQMLDRQPGPRFDEMKITHDACKNEVDLLIGLGDMFRDLSLV